MFVSLSGECPTNVETMVKPVDTKTDPAKAPDVGMIVDFFKENRGRYKRDYQRTGALELFYCVL